jgi:hypothetical protein
MKEPDEPGIMPERSEDLDLDCIRLHDEPLRAVYTLPAPLCDGCWWEWWTEGWPS